ncbi:MAG: hypothetical protein LBE08_13690 [Bifidobacteriaceae bacterium]|nr:hypothetical protein [Bifidobacteriaceae bacterium]
MPDTNLPASRPEPTTQTPAPDWFGQPEPAWQDSIQAAIDGRRFGIKLRGGMEIPPGFRPVLGSR